MSVAAVGNLFMQAHNITQVVLWTAILALLISKDFALKYDDPTWRGLVVAA